MLLIHGGYGYVFVAGLGVWNQSFEVVRMVWYGYLVLVGMLYWSAFTKLFFSFFFSELLIIGRSISSTVNYAVSLNKRYNYFPFHGIRIAMFLLRVQVLLLCGACDGAVNSPSDGCPAPRPILHCIRKRQRGVAIRIPQNRSIPVLCMHVRLESHRLAS